MTFKEKIDTPLQPVKTQTEFAVRHAEDRLKDVQRNRRNKVARMAGAALVIAAIANPVGNWLESGQEHVAAAKKQEYAPLVTAAQENTAANNAARANAAEVGVNVAQEEARKQLPPTPTEQAHTPIP